MARTMTERIWLGSENGPALFQFVELKSKPRKKLLATLAVVAKFAAFLGARNQIELAKSKQLKA